MNKLLKVFQIASVLVLLATACTSQVTQAPLMSLAPASGLLQPGDSLHGMRLAKGAAEAAPLWAFCPSPQQSERMVRAECHIPASTQLAIGAISFPMGRTPTNLDWSESAWEVSLDGRILDLEAFGTYEYALPAMMRPPSHIREAFIKYTSWDIVLSDIQPGTYTLNITAQAGGETYTWNIQLVMEPLESA